MRLPLLGILVMAMALPLAACSGKIQVKGVRVAKTRVESTVNSTTSGTVEARQQAVLGFSAAGRVNRILVRNGDKVTKGQLLAELENRDLETVLRDAEREFRRAEKLHAEGLIANAALDDARQRLEVARANHDRSVLRAPFDGVITVMNLQPGELVQQATAASGTATVKTPIQMIDLQPRIVKGNIDEVDLSKVRVGEAARIKIPAAGAKPFAAEVTRVVPFVSTTREQDRTSEIELKFKESDATIPVGASADIEVVTQAKDDALAVPARVVLGSPAAPDARYAFRAVDGKIEKAAVKVGIGNYERVEITEGVRAGDVLVYPPDNVDLKDGLRVDVKVEPWP